MNKFQNPLLNVALLAIVLLAAGPAAAQILLGGEPDPSFNGNAMQVWLRADSKVDNPGGTVSVWHDKSTHNNDATQDTAADKPTHATGSFNGRHVVNFAGNGDRVEFGTGFDSAFDGSFTIFSLIAPDDGDPFRDSIWFGLISNDEDDRVVLNNAGATDNQIAALYKADTGSANAFIGPPIRSRTVRRTGFTLVSWVVTAGGTYEMFLNGNPTAAATVSGAGVTNANFSSGGVNAFLGSASASNGEDPWPSVNTSFPGGIGEFIIYDGALSTTDREAVEDYLLNFVYPEPSSCILLAMGGLGLLARQRRHG